MKLRNRAMPETAEDALRNWMQSCSLNFLFVGCPVGMDW